MNLKEDQKKLANMNNRKKIKNLKRMTQGEFLGSPVVAISSGCSHCGGPRYSPWLGTSSTVLPEKKEKE